MPEEEEIVEPQEITEDEEDGPGFEELGEDEGGVL